MTKKLITSVIRYILTMFLLYMIYLETGIWTTGAFLLIFISSEIVTVALKGTRKAFEDLVGEL